MNHEPNYSGFINPDFHPTKYFDNKTNWHIYEKPIRVTAQGSVVLTFVSSTNNNGKARWYNRKGIGSKIKRYRRATNPAGHEIRYRLPKHLTVHRPIANSLNHILNQMHLAAPRLWLTKDAIMNLPEVKRGFDFYLDAPFRLFKHERLRNQKLKFVFCKDTNKFHVDFLSHENITKKRNYCKATYNNYTEMHLPYDTGSSKSPRIPIVDDYLESIIYFKCMLDHIVNSALELETRTWDEFVNEHFSHL